MTTQVKKSDGRGSMSSPKVIVVGNNVAATHNKRRKKKKSDNNTDRGHHRQQQHWDRSHPRVEKRRRSLFGCKRVISHNEYSEHLDQLAGSVTREYDLGNGEILKCTTIDFDDDVIEKIDIANFLNCIEYEESIDPILKHRYETTNPEDPGLTKKERKRAEDIVGRKRKVAISSKDLKHYHDHIKEKMWDVTEESTMSRIRADWSKVKEMRRNVTSSSKTCSSSNETKQIQLQQAKMVYF